MTNKKKNVDEEKKFEDDVLLEDKKRRLQEIIQLQNEHSLEWHEKAIGQTFKVLIEGTSKKSEDQFKGRNSAFSMIVFDKKDGYTIGEYANVKVNKCTGATLIGEIVD